MLQHSLLEYFTDPSLTHFIKNFKTNMTDILLPVNQAAICSSWYHGNFYVTVRRKCNFLPSVFKDFMANMQWKIMVKISFGVQRPLVVGY